MEKVRVRLASRGYEILVGPGLLAEVGRLIEGIGSGDKVVIITDATVKGLYGDALERVLSGEGYRVSVLVVPVGEEQKSLETAGWLYQKLTEAYAERGTPVLALGGGVVGDLAGFVASTYMRGVPLVQVPTTLLAQGDSSLGGKVAVNHGRLKNKIGAFYHPRLTISDINTLKTLSPRELSDGLAEIIKHGLIRDGEFFTFLEENLAEIRALDEAVLERVVARSADIKAGVVAQDELDLGLRNILNCGHTVGHAIESVLALGIWHGEAVAIGLLAEARISHRLGILAEEDLSRLRDVLERAGLPTAIPSLEVAGLMQAMRHDKKIVEGRVRFVLPRAIGDVYVTDEVPPALIEEILVEENG